MLKHNIRHVGIILDGNRRFSKRLMMEPWKGHEYGAEKVKKLLSWCKELGIKEVTLYAFSMQNFNRPKIEFNFLMKLFEKSFREAISDPDIHKNKVRFRFIGRTYLFPESVQEQIRKVEKETENYSDYIVNFALAYGGREEMIDAIKKIGRLIEEGKITNKEITEELISKNLYMSDEPDLVIRTGGEKRTSNFLIWQSSYSEWIFLENKTWPEFEKEDLIKCIEEYTSRERRVGGNIYKRQYAFPYIRTANPCRHEREAKLTKRGIDILVAFTRSFSLKSNALLVFSFMFIIFLSASVFAVDPPNITSVILNSTFATNLTTDNLTAYPQGATPSNVSILYDWYKNGALSAVFLGNATSQNVLFSSFTAAGETWFVNATPKNLTNNYDVSAGSFNDTFSVFAQETISTGMAFNNDGTKLYVIGRDSDTITEYDLSTAFDVSTGIFNDNLSVTGEDGTPQGMEFNNDGTKLYMIGSNGDDITEYDLSTAFDVSTGTVVDTFSVSAQETNPTGMAFNNDGTKLYVIGPISDNVTEYDLSTAFDVSTGVFNDVFSVSAQETTPQGMAFNNDGTKLYMIGINSDAITEYNLSTAFDVSTGIFNDNLSVLAEETNPTGMAFNNDGTKLYVIGSFGDDITEYDLGSVVNGATVQSNSVTIIDITPPSFNQTPANQVVEFGSALALDVNASDLAFNNYFINDTTNFRISASTGLLENLTDLGLGILYLNISANDTSGNINSTEITVTTADTISPSFNQTPQNQSLELGSALFLDVNASDTDAVDDYFISDTANFTIDSTSGVLKNNTLLTIGPYVITISVNDSSNNVNSSAITVTVTDSVAPSFNETPQAQALELGTTFLLDVNASDLAFDDYFISDTANFTIDAATGVIKNSSLLGIGTYILNISANDTSNNVNVTNITVTVTDTIAPSFNETPQNQVVEFGNAFFLDINASDLVFDDYFISDTANFTIDAATGVIKNSSLLGIGTYILNISANDTSNNVNTSTITVTVNDTIPPSFNQTPQNTTSLEVGTAYVYQVNASDLSGIDTYSISDTANFSISAPEGTIKNATALDGSYTLTISVNDTQGNTNSTTITIATNDTVSPVITSVTESSIGSNSATITWTTDEAANSTVYYGINLSLGSITLDATSVTSHSISLSSLAESTQYFYNVTSCDVSENCNLSGGHNFTTTAAATTTTTTTTAGGGGGASGIFTVGGAYQTTDSVSIDAKITKLFDLVVPGEDADFNIDIEDIPVILISLSVNKKIDGPSVRVGVLSGRPSSTPMLNMRVYEYIEITAIGLMDEDINTVDIDFRVPKTWLAENDVPFDTVALYRFDGTDWQQLHTLMGVEENGFVRYTTITPGFSFFAIAGESAAGEEPVVEEVSPVIEEVEIQPEEEVEEPVSDMLILLIILALVIAVFIYFAYRKKD